MIRKTIKRIVCTFLAAIMAISVTMPMSGNAAGGNRGTVYMSDNVMRLSDGHGLNFKTVYNKDLGIYETAYCIQHGTSLYSMTEVSSGSIDTHLGTGNINDQIRLALAYGFDSRDNISQTLTISSADGQKYAATQLIVWNIMSGGYDDSFARTPGWFDYVDPSATYASQINSYITDIENSVRGAISARQGGVKVFASASEASASSYPHTDVWDDRSDAERNSIAENIIGFVTDIYDYMLYGSSGRRSEINSQVNNVFSGSMTAQELYDGIWHTAEAQERIDSMSDAEYVTMVYQTILNRAPDQAGLEMHVNRLRSGVSRYDLLSDFWGSPEWELYRARLDVSGGNVYYVFEYELPNGASLSSSAIVSNTTGEDVNFIRLNGNKWRVVLGGTGSVTFRLDLGLSSLPVVWMSDSGNYQEMVSITGSFTAERYISFGARGEIVYNPTSTPTPTPKNSPTPTPVPVRHEPAGVNVIKRGNALTDTRVVSRTVIMGDMESITQNVTVFDMNSVNLRGASFVAVPRTDIYKYTGNSANISRQLVYAAGQRISLKGGNNGVYTLSGLYPGVYDIYETVAPDGFMPISGIVSTVTVSDSVNGYTHTSVVTGRSTNDPSVVINSNGTITCNNTPIDVVIDIEKDIPRGNLTDEEYEQAVGSILFGLYTAKKNEYFDSKVIQADVLVGLAGVTPVRDDEGNVIGGQALFEQDIPDGDYYVREIYSGDAVVDDDNRYHITVDRSGSDDDEIKISLRVQNELKTGKLVVYKYDEWYGTYLEGATFTVYRPDGTVYSVMEWNDDEKYYETEAGYGDYVIRETEAPDGFEPDPHEYQASIREDGDIVRITDAGGIGIANSPRTFDVVIYKIDDNNDSFQLSGAEFGIYEDTNGSGQYEPGEDNIAKSFADGEMVDVTVSEDTDEQGKPVYTLSAPLRTGVYFLVESVCPPGYALNDDSSGIYTLVLGDSDIEGYEIEVEPAVSGPDNVSVRVGNTCLGGIHITKIDESYPDARVSGAEFTVYEDINSNGTVDTGTDIRVGTMTEESAGEYYIRDLPYGDYLVEESASPEYFVRREDIWAVSIREDGKIYDISDTGFEGLWNRFESGSLRIVKLCEDMNTMGISFRVIGTDFSGRSYDQTFITDENGMVFIEGLRAGVYTVSEVDNEVVSGYYLAADRTVTIGADSVEEVIMTNTQREIEVTPTPTSTPVPTPSETPVPTDTPVPTATPTTPEEKITNTGEKASVFNKIGVTMIFGTLLMVISMIPMELKRRKE